MRCACAAEHKRWRLSTSSDWLSDRPAVRSRDHRSRDSYAVGGWSWQLMGLHVQFLAGRQVRGSQLSHVCAWRWSLSTHVGQLCISRETHHCERRRKDKIIVCLRGISGLKMPRWPSLPIATDCRTVSASALYVTRQLRIVYYRNRMIMCKYVHDFD